MLERVGGEFVDDHPQRHGWSRQAMAGPKFEVFVSRPLAHLSEQIIASHRLASTAFLLRAGISRLGERGSTQ